MFLVVANDKYTKTFFKCANNIFSIFGIIKYIVMKIKLLKDHLDHTGGDTIEVTEERGGYLIRVGVGVENKSDKKQTKELKTPYSKSTEQSDAEIKDQNKK